MYHPLLCLLQLYLNSSSLAIISTSVDLFAIFLSPLTCLTFYLTYFIFSSSLFFFPCLFPARRYVFPCLLLSISPHALFSHSIPSHFLFHFSFSISTPPFLFSSFFHLHYLSCSLNSCIFSCSSHPFSHALVYSYLPTSFPYSSSFVTISLPSYLATFTLSLLLELDLFHLITSHTTLYNILFPPFLSSATLTLSPLPVSSP